MGKKTSFSQSDGSCGIVIREHCDHHFTVVHIGQIGCLVCTELDKLSVFPGLRLNTLSSGPVFMRLAAIPMPMRPSPTNPSFIGSSPYLTAN